MILTILAREPMHGYGISQRLTALSRDEFHVNPGSRTNEIGVRMSLGASSKDILLSFSRRGLALTLIGLAVGMLLSFNAARVMTTLFYGFQPNYMLALAVVSLVLLAVAALACLVPARRASRIDPMMALQQE
jgi:putative ABC transport system permease protein